MAKVSVLCENFEINPDGLFPICKKNLGSKRLGDETGHWCLHTEEYPCKSKTSPIKRRRTAWEILNED